MDKLEIKLKDCCLTCDNFYLDNGRIGLIGCGPCGPRWLSCLHMPVCSKYHAADTLADKSGGGALNP